MTNYFIGVRYLIDPSSKLPDTGYYLLDAGSASVYLFATTRSSEQTKEEAVLIAKEYGKEVNLRDIKLYSINIPLFSNRSNFFHILGVEYPGEFWQYVGIPNPFTANGVVRSRRDFYLEYVMSLKLFWYVQERIEMS